MNINNDLQQSYQRRGCIFVYITILARCCGLIALTGLIFVAYLEWLGIGSLNSRVYITFVTIVVAYLELLWVFNKFITCCICCFRSEACYFWMCYTPIDNWIKSIIYTALAIPFFVSTWVPSLFRIDTNVVGLLLIITSLVYFVKTFKYKNILTDENNEEINIIDSPSLTRTSSTVINESSSSKETHLE
ncbi:unnamed protein product [Adineta ricciae]|uniref:Uncharacterized protein n=1 Tax=Adineta ricciae TaxID=249248 RepID=A0A814II56_ADIRI|nr:unnamed protein product [Adineta ricciae]